MIQLRLLYQIPDWIRFFYRGAIWRGDKSQKYVYLTFDDGPVPEATPHVLDILDHYGVKATFFWVGENVSRYPALAREVIRRGHSVGNHSYHHVKGLKSGNSMYFDDIRLADKVIQEVAGDMWREPHLFRPPYGRAKPSQRRWLAGRYRMVLWDVITHDYNPNYTPERIVRIVRRYVRNGSIILFHDSIKSKGNTLPALPKAIEWLQREGYVFKTL